jgi:hypothetical protein
VTAADFNTWLESQNFTCPLAVPGVGGAGQSGEVGLSITKLRSFSLAQVVAQVEPLARLLKVAGQVKDLQQALTEVEAITGPGEFLDQLKAVVAEAAPAPASAPGGDIFEQAEVPKDTAPAAQAVSAFVAKGRQGPSSTRRSKGARKLRDAIEAGVYGAARAALATPEVSALEEGLRGLHLLTQQCTRNTGMHVEVVDVPLDQVLKVLEERERGDWVDEPDAIFVPGDVSDPEVLQELADMADEMMCPLVVGVKPTFVEDDELPHVADALEVLKPEKVDRAWLTLRQEESSRWLCGVVNRVVLWAEGSGVATRTVLGSGVWAVAAILASSYKDMGSFARLTGKAGALSVPGVHTLTSGRHAGTAVPTEYFLAIRHQQNFALHGLLALGSAKQSDKVVLATTPTMRASRDAVPLAAQLLTGRLVRFAMWVRDQVPTGATDEMVDAMFRDAAAVFLFPGMQEIGRVGAKLVEEEGQKSLLVEAKVHHAYAGIPFEIAFPLPLR